MNNSQKYKEIIEAKNGSFIPVFFDGKSVDSKYNPDRESDCIINNLEINYKFYIVIGIASGILINKLTEKFPESKILAIETSMDDLIFLRSLPLVQKLESNANVIFTDLDHLEEKLINNYLPAFHGDLKIIEQRGWMDENSDLIPILNNKLNRSMGIISADYSVQSHFGKIWQSNIMNNLNKLSLCKHKITEIIDNTKTAVVVAAGPTLDNTINQLKENKEKYFIIATDTAYSILIRNNIIPDAAISIDGQFISKNHFNKILNNKTLFFLDLCSNHSIGMSLIKKSCKVFYFISGHPLSTLANKISNNKFMQLFSGAGTVTITAIDLCIKLGFKNIKILGADFSYINGKSYGKGSYFDIIYNINQNKISTVEKQYDSLMYRTELIRITQNRYTTSILNAYKSSLDVYLKNSNCDFKIENDIYNITQKKSQSIINEISAPEFNYKQFKQIISTADENDLLIPLLPYIAWMRNNKLYKNYDFNSLLKLAQSHIVSYN